jgi:hypothetical protein
MHCNDPVFRQSPTLETFIAPVERPTDNPVWYHELDVSPAGAMFASLVKNTREGNSSACARCVEGRLRCDGRSTFPPFELDVSTGNHSAGWHEALFIPFDLFEQDFLPRSRGAWPLWRVNLYRYDYPEGPNESFDNFELSAWSPTHSPSFHVPSRFGVVLLVDGDGAPLPAPAADRLDSSVLV